MGCIYTTCRKPWLVCVLQISCRATKCYEKLGERRYVPEIIFSTQITLGSRFLQLGIIVGTTITFEINDLKNQVTHSTGRAGGRFLPQCLRESRRDGLWEMPWAALPGHLPQLSLLRSATSATGDTCMMGNPRKTSRLGWLIFYVPLTGRSLDWTLFWVCRWRCFFKRLAFESWTHWSKLPSPKCGGNTQGSEGMNRREEGRFHPSFPFFTT